MMLGISGALTTGQGKAQNRTHAFVPLTHNPCVKLLIIFRIFFNEYCDW